MHGLLPFEASFLLSSVDLPFLLALLQTLFHSEVRHRSKAKVERNTKSRFGSVCSQQMQMCTGGKDQVLKLLEGPAQHYRDTVGPEMTSQDFFFSGGKLRQERAPYQKFRKWQES